MLWHSHIYHPSHQTSVASPYPLESLVITVPFTPHTLTQFLLSADNVGDNVGDIAGMGADLFGSFAESTCAALVISSVSTLGTEHVYVAMCYPLLISAVGILVCLLTTLIATDLKPARGINDIQSTLKWQLVIATVLATPVSAFPLTQSVSASRLCLLNPSIVHC